MPIFENQFVSLYYFEASKHIEILWNEFSVDMTEDDYKRSMEQMTEQIELCKPEKNLVDTTDFMFTIVPVMQEWTNGTIFPRHLTAGIQKAAFFVSKNIFSQVSVEQAMEEDEGGKFETRYFEDKENALNWLLAEK